MAYELFHNKPLVDALLDRLQHHCIKICINGPSLRDPGLTASDTPPAATPVTPKDKSPRRTANPK